MATYRIAVGKRHKVEPRQIVGAIANEGGLAAQDFGHIDIRADHSLVELPADLPGGAWAKLADDPDLRQADRAALDAGGSGGAAEATARSAASRGTSPRGGEPATVPARGRWPRHRC